MVQLMLKGFGGDQRKPASVDAAARARYGIECYHVNAQVSKELEDIGDVRFGKLFLLFGYCIQAIWCRFRYGVSTLYYIPAPGKRSALYRDWLVMFLCRPFYKRIILHWHAAGLANWLETHVQIRSRSFTYHRMKDADLSIVLSQFNVADAEKLLAQQIRVVPVGIPDPCPKFDEKILPLRRERTAARKRILSGGGTAAESGTVNVLFVAHCTREKGVFETVAGLALANEQCAAKNLPLRFRLTLIGAFASPQEEQELRGEVQKRGLAQAAEILGFVSKERKEAALAEADIFCFPTYYLAENQPANLIEAMAYGLPVVTTRWRSIPEMLPVHYPGLVEPKSPAQVADALMRLAAGDFAAELREIFRRRFTLEQYLAGMAAAIQSVETADRRATPLQAGQPNPNPTTT